MLRVSINIVTVTDASTSCVSGSTSRYNSGPQSPVETLPVGPPVQRSTPLYWLMRTSTWLYPGAFQEIIACDAGCPHMARIVLGVAVIDGTAFPTG